MRTPFVPVDFTIPETASLGNYILAPISITNNQEDFKAITENADIITKMRGGSGDKNKWPYAFTLEENYKDLAWLETCFSYRQLFSYIIRSAADNAYVGCLYIYPIELLYPEKAHEFDVDFSFWITEKEFNKGVYNQITELLLGWLRTNWPFDSKRIYFRNRLSSSISTR